MVLSTATSAAGFTVRKATGLSFADASALEAAAVFLSALAVSTTAPCTATAAEPWLVLVLATKPAVPLAVARGRNSLLGTATNSAVPAMPDEPLAITWGAANTS